MEESVQIEAGDLPAGDYAIVEVLGHRTLVGRVSEIERFGTKMLQIEALFADVMLAPVLLGGGSIYQFTPCSPEIAFARRPRNNWQLPASLFAVVPPAALPSNEEGREFFADDEDGEDLER